MEGFYLGVVWSHRVRRCRIRKMCDPRMVRSCRVIKSGFVSEERSALSVVPLEVEVIVRCAVVMSDNDNSRS